MAGASSFCPPVTPMEAPFAPGLSPLRRLSPLPHPDSHVEACLQGPPRVLQKAPSLPQAWQTPPPRALVTEAGPAAQRDGCCHPRAVHAVRLPGSHGPSWGRWAPALLCRSASVPVDGWTSRHPADSVRLLLGRPGNLPSSIPLFILEDSGTEGSQECAQGPSAGRGLQIRTFFWDP